MCQIFVYPFYSLAQFGVMLVQCCVWQVHTLLVFLMQTLHVVCTHIDSISFLSLAAFVIYWKCIEQESGFECVCVCVWVCVCVRACVRACVRGCGRTDGRAGGRAGVCLCVYIYIYIYMTSHVSTA